ncbi:hypothetical protein [Emticicia fontis]
MSNYVLRATNFFYDDHYTFDPKYTHWRIHSKYDNLESAIKAKEELEVKAMREYEPFLFFELHGYNKYEATKKQVDEYLLKEFNLIVDDSERKEFKIPRSASKAQALAIKAILNVDFYKLIEFKVDIIFYKPIMNESFWGKSFMDLCKPNIFEIEYKGYAFFDSEEDATLNTPKILKYWLGEYSKNIYGLCGTLEELSQKPLELKELLENSKDLMYNSADKRIEIKDYWIKRNSSDLIQLINLLTSKPYELVPISYEAAQRLGYLGRGEAGSGPYGDGYHYS